MSTANSPVPKPSIPAAKTPLKTVQALTLQLLRRMKGKWAAPTLPFVARQVCETYLSEAHQSHQAKCRRILQTRLTLNPAQLQQFFQTALGDLLVTWFARFMHPPAPHPPTPALKELFIQLATEPEGISLLDLWRRSPKQFQFNLEQILQTARQVEALFAATDTLVSIIRELAIAEAHTQPPLPDHSLDLQQPGPWPVTQTTWEWPLNPGEQPIPILCYQPRSLPPGPIPLLIQSHGLAANPEDFAPHAHHLASYGYVVVAPQHPGSSSDQVRRLLAGEANEVFEQTEFLARPRTISRLIDRLTTHNTALFEGRLNTDCIGVMGNSFGAYTALALAGATIQFTELETSCDLANSHPNISLLLQCQALQLPHTLHSAYDSRVGAIIAIDTVGSAIFGSMGLHPIQIPVLLIAGSHDLTAPLACEQIRLFQWLTTPIHYLALMQGKTHLHNPGDLLNTLNLHLKLHPHPLHIPHATPFVTYTAALSLAFLNQHLGINTPHFPPFNARYVSTLSQSPYDIWLLSQASQAQLNHQISL